MLVRANQVSAGDDGDCAAFDGRADSGISAVGISWERSSTGAVEGGECLSLVLVLKVCGR